MCLYTCSCLLCTANCTSSDPMDVVWYQNLCGESLEHTQMAFEKWIKFEWILNMFCDFLFIRSIIPNFSILGIVVESSTLMTSFLQCIFKRFDFGYFFLLSFIFSQFSSYESDECVHSMWMIESSRLHCLRWCRWHGERGGKNKWRREVIGESYVEAEIQW